LNKKSALIAVIAVSPTTVRRERASDEPSDKQQAVTRYRGRSSRMITQHFSVISACEIQAVGIRLPRNFTSAKPRARARLAAFDLDSRQFREDYHSSPWICAR